MTQKEIQEKLSAKRKGTYFTLMYRKHYGDYTQTTTTTVRLANYYHVVKKEPATSAKKNTHDIYLGNNLIFNENTQKTRLQVFLTNNKYHHPKSVYEYQGSEISVEEFYEGSGKKPSNVSVMFTLNIEDIVAIY